jgi:tetratricopeptide (TPR) repeat protein
MEPAGSNWVTLSVSALVHGVPDPDPSEARLRRTFDAVATDHPDDAVGAEALFLLARICERAGESGEAVLRYRAVAERQAAADNPWPFKATEQLAAILRPWMEGAVKSGDDLTLVTLFHRHGPIGAQVYAQTALLLDVAEAHRRLGFAPEAIHLYQAILKQAKDAALLEPALIGLGRTYLDQQDAPAARKVFERYRFQFPTGRYERDVLTLLVAALERQRDWPALLHLCRTWLLHHRVHPERAGLYVALARALAAQAHVEASVIAYEEAIKEGAAQTPELLLAYADQLSHLERRQEAVAAYRTALDKHPTASQAEWAHLQTAIHHRALKQYDRATVALAELGAADDALINRVSQSVKGSVQSARRPLNGEGL